MKLPAIHLFPIELEIRGQPAPKGAEPLQQFLSPRFSRDPEAP
jgi:hypothetical protein